MGWIFDGIVGSFLGWIFKTSYDICSGIEEAFGVLLFGYKENTVNHLGEVEIKRTSLLDLLLDRFETNETLRNVFIVMVALAVVILICSILLSFLKAMISHEGDFKKVIVKNLFNSTKAILFIVLVPTVIFFINSSLTTIFNVLEENMEFELGITDRLWDIIVRNPSVAGEFSGAATLPPGKIGGLGQLEHMNSGIGIIVYIVLALAFCKALFIVIKRVVDIGILLVISPVPIASYPADDGERFGIWRNLMIGKLLSIIGILFSFFIFTVLIQVAEDMLELLSDRDNLHGINTIAAEMIFFAIVIIGALGVSSSGTIISNLINQQAAQAAQQDQQLADTMVNRGKQSAFRASMLAMGGAGAVLRATSSGANFLKKGSGYIPKDERSSGSLSQNSVSGEQGQDSNGTSSFSSGSSTNADNAINDRVASKRLARREKPNAFKIVATRGLVGAAKYSGAAYLDRRARRKASRELGLNSPKQGEK